MTTPTPLPLRAFLALLLGGIAIGFAGIFMRLSDVNPVASAFWRMALAAPVLWCWAYKLRAIDRGADRLISFSPALAWAGIFFASDMGIWHLSLHYTTVSNATLLSNFAPVCIALWLWLAYRQRFQPVFLIGMVIALGGAILLVSPNASDGSTTKLIGDGLGLLTAFFMPLINW